MAAWLFLIWLSTTVINCTLVLPKAGHWFHWLLWLVTLTPANIIWFGAMKYALSRGGQALGVYRARGNSLYYDKEFKLASTLLILFTSVALCCRREIRFSFPRPDLSRC